MKASLLVSITSAAAAATALATPSGLNNIPTGDTVAHRTVAVQTFDTIGGGSHDLWAGFKTGWDFEPVHLEWGLDSRLGPDPAGPLYFQTKLGIAPWEDGLLAVGVANVGLSDTGRAGDPFTYAVLTQDFKIARLSVGYGLQNDNNSLLLGVDRTWKVLERNLNLNADLVQTGDQSGWLASAGFKFEVCRHVVFEAWANLPDKGDASATVKLNYVFTF